MIASDRRRVAAASLFTVLALPALWVLNRESAATSSAPTVGAAGVEVASPEVVAPIGDQAAPTTAPYVPDPPLFVSGESDAEAPSGPAVVNVAVPPAPGPTEVVGNASFRRFAAGSRQCTTLLAPDGASLTVVNVDNGQTTTCTNTYGMAIPAGADIVLHTDVFSEIGDLADAPVPVRVSW
ncbi:MAG: hypothetical protein Q8M22_03490 [Actinomycetota bacterium]|nr:hypothetical protein [Actinomycetota bacterium]